jgi:hypothetical protein
MINDFVSKLEMLEKSQGDITQTIQQLRAIEQMMNT